MPPRPTNWSALDLGGDPTPGELELITRNIEFFRQMRQLTQELKGGLDAAMGTAGDANFRGKTADALRDHMKDKIGPFLQSLIYSSDETFQAFTQYSDAMATAQRDADGALAEAQALGERPGDDTPESRTARDEFDRKIAALRAKAERARQDQQNAGNAAADRIRMGRKDFKDLTSFWDEFWQTLGILALVLTLPAIILGGPLGLIAFGLNAAIFVKTAVDYANGKATVAQLVFAGLGLLGPTTKPLLAVGTAGNLFKSLRSFVSDAMASGRGALAIAGRNMVSWGTLFVRNPVNALGILGKGAITFGFTIVSKAGMWVVSGFRGLPGLLRSGGGLVVTAFKMVPGVVRYNFGGWRWLGTVLPVAARDIQRFGVVNAFKMGFVERGVGWGHGAVKARFAADGLATVNKLVGIAGNLAIAPIIGKNMPNPFGTSDAAMPIRSAPLPSPLKLGDVGGAKGVNVGAFMPGGETGKLMVPKSVMTLDGTVFNTNSKGLSVPEPGTLPGVGATTVNAKGLHIPVSSVGSPGPVPTGQMALGVPPVPAPHLAAGLADGPGSHTLANLLNNSATGPGPIATRNGFSMSGTGTGPGAGPGAGPLGMIDPPALGLNRLGVNFSDIAAANKGATMHLEAATDLVLGLARGLDRMDMSAVRSLGETANPNIARYALPPGGPGGPATPLGPVGSTPGAVPGTNSVMYSPSTLPGSATHPGSGVPSAPAAFTTPGPGAPGFRDGVPTPAPGHASTPPLPPSFPAGSRPVPGAGGGWGSDILAFLGMGAAATAVRLADDTVARAIRVAVPEGTLNTPAAQSGLWGRLLDDLADRSDVGKGKPKADPDLPHSRLAAWQELNLAQGGLVNAQRTYDDLAVRMANAGEEHSGANLASELALARNAVTDARSEVARAAGNLRAWDVDPAAASTLHTRFMTEWGKAHPGVYGGSLLPNRVTYSNTVLGQVPADGQKILNPDRTWRIVDDQMQTVSETRLLTDKRIQYVNHDPNSPVAWQLWEGRDPGTANPVPTHTAFRMENGDFRVVGAGGDGTFEVWHGGPNSPGGHTVVENGRRIDGERFHIAPGAAGDGAGGATAGGYRWEIWDNNGTPVYQGRDMPGGPGFQVFDRASDGRVLWEHWDSSDLAGRQVVSRAAPGPGTNVHVDHLNPPPGSASWERWDSPNPGTHNVVESLTRLPDGRFQHVDQTNPGRAWELRDNANPNPGGHTVLARADHLPGGGVQVTHTAPGAPRAFEVWDNAAVDAHTVQRFGTALGDGRFKVEAGHPLAPGYPNWQVWGNADAARPNVLREGVVQADGTHMVFDGAPGRAPRTWERWDSGDVGNHNVLERVGPGPNANTFEFRDFRPNGDRPWQVWDSPDNAAHTTLKWADRQPDGTFRMTDETPGTTNPWQVWDTGDPSTRTILKSADLQADGTYRIVDNTPGATTPWQIWDRPALAPGAEARMQADLVPGGPHAGLFQITDRTPGRTFDFQLWNSADPGARIVVGEGRRLPNGQYHLVDPRTNATRAFEIWNTADPGSVRWQADALGRGDFRVVDTRADSPHAWERWHGGDPGNPSLLDIVLRRDIPRPSVLERSTLNGNGTHTVVDLTNNRIPARTFDDATGDLRSLELRNGDRRVIDWNTNTWQDMRTPPRAAGGAPGAAPAPVPLTTKIHTGDVVPGPNGTYKLMDANGSPVFTKERIAQADGTFGTKESYRDHTGRWVWKEFDRNGNAIRHGARYVDWAENYRDVTSGKFGVDRHLVGTKAYEYRVLADKGLLRAEFHPDGAATTWTRFDAQGNEILRGTRDTEAGRGKAWQDVITHIENRPVHLADGADRLVAQQQFSPLRYGSPTDGKFFSAIDKNRNFREFTWNPAGADDAAKISDYREINYVFEEVATAQRLADGNVLKLRRIHQQRFDSSWAGRADFPGSEDRLFRHWRWNEKGPDGLTVEGRSGIRFTRMDGTWQDFTENGVLVRESRVLANGNKLEYGVDPANPTRWVEKDGAGNVVHTGNRVFGGDPTAAPTASPGHRTQWFDVRTNDAGGVVVHRATFGNSGNVREFGTPVPHNADFGAGDWIEKSRFGQIVARRDDLGNGVFLHAEGNPRSGNWTWSAQNGDGTVVTVRASDAADAPEVPLTGVRVTNKADGNTLWNRPFDDGYRDLGADGRVVREVTHLDGGRTLHAVRDVGSDTTRWTVKGAGGAAEALPAGWSAERTPLPGGGWRDELVGPGNARTVVREFNPGTFETIKQWHHSFDANGNLTRSADRWLEIRNGDGYRSHEPVVDPNTGAVTGYLEKDLKYLQWREYDANHNLVALQTTSTKVWEIGAPGSGWNPERSWVTGYEVPDGFQQAGRLVDNKGFFNEFRGYNRMLRDTNRFQWGPPAVPGAVQNGSGLWTFNQKAWQKAGLDGIQGFVVEALSGTIATLIINDGDFTLTDLGRVALNAAVGGAFAAGASRLHELRAGGGALSPKRFKDGLLANDFGKPFNHNPYFGDQWRSDWSHFDTPLRWRSGTYQFGVAAFLVSPLQAFVNGAVNAAVFGDRNGVHYYGADALLVGAQAMAGAVVAGASVGAARFGLEGFLAGRYWRKSGLSDILLRGSLSFGTSMFNNYVFNPAFRGGVGLTPPTPPPPLTIDATDPVPPEDDGGGGDQATQS